MGVIIVDVGDVACLRQADVDMAVLMHPGQNRHCVVDVDVVWGMWSMWRGRCGVWLVVDVAWSTGRGHKCPHPSTRGEGQGEGW